MLWIFSLLAFVLAAFGYRSASRTRLSAYTSSFTSGLVAGLGLLVALPEAVSAYGVAWALAGAAAGMDALALFDHWVHPVCESCAQSGVVLAMLLHAVCDGAIAGAGGLIAWGVLAHRLPEAFLTGMLLRSLNTPPSWAAAQIVLLHAAFGLSYWLMPGSVWATGGMAVAGGALLYLGLHRWHTADAQAGWRMVPAGLAGFTMSLFLR